jgi:predicted dehydrogenase
MSTSSASMPLPAFPDGTGASVSPVERAATERLRVGIIGAGLIAQVMHLPYLRELADRFEIVALCDIVPTIATAVAQRFGISQTFSDWRALLDQEMDAVLVLTSGNHARIAIEAAQRGIHVLVEKPMCYSVAEGQEMVAAADERHVTLMVGYQKRYDPAYLRFLDEVKAVDDPRLLRIVTLESPYWPYVEHYASVPVTPPAPDALAGLQADSAVAVRRAIGETEPTLRAIYEHVLLGSLVHELNALRGVLGEPDQLEHASLRPGSLSLIFRFGDVPVSLDRVDLPGIARYRMEFALYGPNRRVTLSWPSPFLRSEPTLISVEDGQAGTTRSRLTEEITSYESAFKRELVAFHDAVVRGVAPATPGSDVVRDIALCQAIIEAARTGRSVGRPSEPR